MNRRHDEGILPRQIAREGMGEIPKRIGAQDGSSLNPSGLHGEDLGRDTKIWDARKVGLNQPIMRWLTS